MGILLQALAILVVFYWLYVLMMGVYRAFLKKKLQGLALVLLAPPLAVAFLLDVVLQFTLAALIFVEWPRKGEWFVTHRLRSYIRQGSGWRWRIADVLCRRMLDPFDPTGAHCDDKPPTLNEIH